MKQIIVIILILFISFSNSKSQTYNFVVKSGNTTKVYPVSDIGSMYFTQLNATRDEHLHVFLKEDSTEIFDLKELKDLTLLEDIDGNIFKLYVNYEESGREEFDLEDVDRLKFTSTLKTGLEETVELYPVRTYPNPFTDKTRIVLSNRISKNISVKIVDINGILIKDYPKNAIDSDNELIWDGTDTQSQRVPKGSYYVIINEGNSVEMLKLIKIDD